MEKKSRGRNTLSHPKTNLAHSALKGTLLLKRMRLSSNRQCGAEGDGKKMDQAPPIRNPFVHVLKFTPLEKAQVKSGRFTIDTLLKIKKKERFATFFCC